MKDKVPSVSWNKTTELSPENKTIRKLGSVLVNPSPWIKAAGDFGKRCIHTLLRSY